MFSNQAKECNPTAAAAAVDFSPVGSEVNRKMAALAAGSATSGNIRTPSAANEVLNSLDGLIHRLMAISDNAEGLADRLMGGYPATDGREKKPYAAGLLGEIEQRLDMLKTVTDSLATHVERLQRLG